jgi:hypothetical protein
MPINPATMGVFFGGKGRRRRGLEGGKTKRRSLGLRVEELRGRRREL